MIDDLKAAISSFLSLCGNQWTGLFFCILYFVVSEFFATALLLDGIIVTTLFVTVVGVAVVMRRVLNILR